MDHFGNYESVFFKNNKILIRLLLDMPVTLSVGENHSMTNAEAKNAMLYRTPVTYNGITYSYISAIICRYDNQNNMLVSLELTDRNKRSVTIAQIKDVTIYDNQNQTTTFLP